MMLRSRYNANGVLTCHCGSKRPAGRCGCLVAGTAVGLTFPDRTCRECGYSVHAPTCPTRQPKPAQRTGVGKSYALGQVGPFRVGDVVVCVDVPPGYESSRFRLVERTAVCTCPGNLHYGNCPALLERREPRPNDVGWNVRQS